MVRVCRRCEVAFVTRLAFCRSTGILLAQLPLMARLAIHNRVDSHQREAARSMNLEYLLLILPTASRVTILTSRS